VSSEGVAMFLKELSLIIAAGLAVSSPAQTVLPQNPASAPVPSDPLEIVTGPVQVADTPESRKAALDLLARARGNYALRNTTRGYDLKVSFTVTSGGETQYDGAWQMEEIFVPHQGLRWTAQAAAGYTTTRIAANKHFYAEGTTNTIPLRLHDARAALFGPIATPRYAGRDLIRTSAATLDGHSVTCVLLSGARNPATPTPGRRWLESEECIDPQSGLLLLHSLAPGDYQTYDYANGPSLGNYRLPKKIVETEGGKTVMVLQVDSLTGLDTSDPELFKPTEAMTSGEPGVVLGEARKMSFFANSSPIPNGAAVDSVCVFGLITPSGQLVEAHSLQPSDPHSSEAVALAKHVKLAAPVTVSARPEQQFGFVIEKFVSPAGGQP